MVVKLTSCQDGGSSGQLLVDVVVGQEVGHRRCDLVPDAADVGLLAQQREARHGHQHRLHVDAPKVHQENHLPVKGGQLFEAHYVLRLMELATMGEGASCDFSNKKCTVASNKLENPSN